MDTTQTEQSESPFHSPVGTHLCVIPGTRINLGNHVNDSQQPIHGLDSDAEMCQNPGKQTEAKQRTEENKTCVCVCEFIIRLVNSTTAAPFVVSHPPVRFVPLHVLVQLSIISIIITNIAILRLTPCSFWHAPKSAGPCSVSWRCYQQHSDGSKYSVPVRTCHTRP